MRYSRMRIRKAFFAFFPPFMSLTPGMSDKVLADEINAIALAISSFIFPNNFLYPVQKKTGFQFACGPFRD